MIDISGAISCYCAIPLPCWPSNTSIPIIVIEPTLCSILSMQPKTFLPRHSTFTMVFVKGVLLRGGRSLDLSVTVIVNSTTAGEVLRMLLIMIIIVVIVMEVIVFLNCLMIYVVYYPNKSLFNIWCIQCTSFYKLDIYVNIWLFVFYLYLFTYCYSWHSYWPRQKRQPCFS